MVRQLLVDFPKALLKWKATDPILAAVAERGPPQPRPGETASAFASLVESLIHQQVSLAAGRSILRKVRMACEGRITPEAIERLGPSRLRTAGVSPQKQRYVLDLARRVGAGELDFRRIGRANDEAVIEALTQVTGIGVWTAKMFLMFHLQRPDVVAPEDLGLRLAASRLYKIPISRTARFIERRSETWKPYRTLACLTLWQNKSG